MIKYSIIIPLYNKAPYVRHALESIAAQTFRDYEVIIVDDGSTDGSLDVVRDFVRNDGMSRLRLNEPHALNDDRFKILTQSNSGVAVTRNNGVAKSKGEYVCFLDADDWWEATYLEEMYKLIREYPDAGLYATNYIYYKPGKTHVALKIERGYINYPEAYVHSDAMPVWTGAACMPRKVFDEMGGFPIGIKLGEDFLLWAKTALHYKVAFCEKALAYYNNDVPASLRATRNLHKPEYHMLFNMSDIESIVDGRLSIVERGEWKALLDKLRVNGLMNFWLDERYHDAAAAELKKVDWSKQPRKAKAQYEKPIWILKATRLFRQIGSFCKQIIIKMITN